MIDNFRTPSGSLDQDIEEIEIEFELEDLSSDDEKSIFIPYDEYIEKYNLDRFSERQAIYMIQKFPDLFQEKLEDNNDILSEDHILAGDSNIRLITDLYSASMRQLFYNPFYLPN